MIQVTPFPVGALQANCYILSNPETHEAVIVDPGDEPDRIAQYLEKQSLTPVAIWNTHAHIDHINGNASLKERYKIPITIHEREKDWLQSDFYTVARFAGVHLNISHADSTWKGGETVEALGAEWRIYNTPGHSPGGVSIVCAEQDIMVAGDFLFEGSIGRLDLPEGDEASMIESLKRCFGDWGVDSWKVYPGHGSPTTIGQERRSNPFVLQYLS